MVHRKGLVMAAASAALTLAGYVQADTDTPPPDDGLTVRPAYLDATTGPATTEATTAPAAPTPPTPLMAALGAVGLKQTLDNLHTTVGGFVDVGYTQNLGYGGVSPGGRFQDNFTGRVKLDQFDFAVDRPVDYSAGKFDIGAHFEFIYGRDTDFFHSSGIYDNPAVLGLTTGTYYRGVTSPEDQVDINQAYVDLAIPVGTGLRVRLGKFVTLLGYETINPTSNSFFSHSFLFTYAIPLTQTGVMTEYKINADWQLDAGVTRGWNQSLRDNNGAADFLGTVTWTPQESDFLKKLNVAVSLSEGPQSTHDNHDYWTVLDVIARYQMLGDGVADGSLLLAVNGDYGDAPHGVVTSSAQWVGLAGYAKYVINSYAAANLRLEWYDDAQGFTLAGFGTPTVTPAGSVNLYEATVGVSVTPFPSNDILKNLVVRPETRFDYAGKAFYPGGNPHFQATLGLDVYFIY